MAFILFRLLDEGDKNIMKVKYMTVYEGQQYNLSQYPNFHKSGSVRGMKKQFYGKDALIVRSGKLLL